MATIGFSGGALLDAKLREIADRLGKSASVDVGFHPDANYADGVQPVAMVAAIQNYGAPEAGIPARPFFSEMVRENSPNWGNELAGILVAEDYDGVRALRSMGEVIAGQLAESITQANFVPLAPATVARKGFSAQLIDTGTMRRSIKPVVKE